MKLSNELPLVSIVSPCFNHSRFVIESLESIRRQTYQNIEHIIIDDCSTDDSVEKIEGWIKSNNYKCIFIKHEKNKGLSATLNESISISSGEFWSSLATDDIADPVRTEIFIDFFLQKKEYYMICSDCCLINEASEKINKNGTSSFLKYYSGYINSFYRDKIGTFESLVEGNYIPGSLMIKKSVFQKIEMFDEHLRMEDWDMWLRISNLHKIGYNDKQLTQYRFHNSNTIGSSYFLESFKTEVLIILYKAKKYCSDKRVLKKIDKKLANHIYFYFSLNELKSKKEYFTANNATTLYYKIMALFYPNKLKLSLYRWYARLSEKNVLKQSYKSFKSHLYHQT